jgi:hypothetical protein
MLRFEVRNVGYMNYLEKVKKFATFAKMKPV